MDDCSPRLRTEAELEQKGVAFADEKEIKRKQNQTVRCFIQVSIEQSHELTVLRSTDLFLFMYNFSKFFTPHSVALLVLFA